MPKTHIRKSVSWERADRNNTQPQFQPRSNVWEMGDNFFCELPPSFYCQCVITKLIYMSLDVVLSSSICSEKRSQIPEFVQHVLYVLTFAFDHGSRSLLCLTNDLFTCTSSYVCMVVTSLQTSGSMTAAGVQLYRRYRQAGADVQMYGRCLQ